MATNNGNIERWNLDSSRCSDFLVAMFYWQAAMGGLPFVGIANIDTHTFNKINREWDFITEYLDAKIYSTSGVSIYVYGLPDYIELAVGCNHKKTFLEIAEKLEINWNYNSINDE